MNYLTVDTYAKFRPLIKSGDLLAWSGTSSFGNLIRRWTGSSYSHVGIAWVIGDRVFVLEALDGRGVVISPLSNRLSCYHIETRTNWTVTMEAKALALQLIGKPYSYLDALRAGLHLKPRSGGYQCVKYAAEVLHLQLPNYVPDTLVSLLLEREANFP